MRLTTEQRLEAIEQALECLLVRELDKTTDAMGQGVLRGCLQALQPFQALLGPQTVESEKTTTPTSAST